MPIPVQRHENMSEYYTGGSVIAYHGLDCFLVVIIDNLGNMKTLGEGRWEKLISLQHLIAFIFDLEQAIAYFL